MHCCRARELREPLLETKAQGSIGAEGAPTPRVRPGVERL